MPRAVRVAEIVDLEGNRHVLEARAGSSDAFERVVQDVIGWAHRLAAVILGSEDAAADATQNALVAAWRELPQLRDTDRFDPWFRRILVNECRMQLRRDGRAREVPMPDDPEGLGRLVGASRTLVQVEAVDLLDRAFERLDPDDRVLIALHYLDGRPLSEIADAVHLPLGTVKWRLHEARRTILQALEAME